MKQVVQNYKTGELRTELVPSPSLRPGGVLVRNHYSLISAGTEKTKVDTARMSLLGKARSRPDQVRKVLETLKKEGFSSTYRKVMGKLEALTPLGYSSAGVVTAVGPGVTEFQVGDRVACAGAGYANHAEEIFIPKNLCVPVPKGLGLDQAAFTTVGAIAMQGVRQADTRLGEMVAVIGLGLLGQLTVQLLKAAGCRVLGIDVDPMAVDLAVECGATRGAVRGRDDVEGVVGELSGGYGVDAVIITAGTRSNDPVELAGRICRDRGRVVVVGAVGMALPREPYYMKELELRLSRSYGPGRYDVSYEEKGHDYPIGYVRWTEKRNMEAFVQLLAERRVDLSRLISHRFQVEEAEQAYDLVSGKKSERFVGILLEYSPERELETRVPLTGSQQAAGQAHVGVGLIGAGSFAKSMILPHLKDAVSLRGIQTATGLTARDVGDRFGFAFAASEPAEVLADADTQAVFITTRHNTHAELTVQALEAGKAVFVEKPLALNVEDLKRVITVSRAVNGRLMVGFNRRFAPMVVETKKFFGNRTEPLAINIRVNAGFIPKDHWIQDPEEGGRILGEACHFVDLVQFLAGSPIVRVFADAAFDTASGGLVEDIACITLRMQDGSVATITYLSNGDPSQPKERIEVFGGGAIALIEDFRLARFTRGGRSREVRHGNQDKGHAAEVTSFIQALKTGGGMPISLDALANSTLATLRVVESLRSGKPEHVSLS